MGGIKVHYEKIKYELCDFETPAYISIPQRDGPEKDMYEIVFLQFIAEIQP